jgi:PAS domain S-box-containing protein
MFLQFGREHSDEKGVNGTRGRGVTPPGAGKTATRQAGLLFVLAGALTILNNYVPGSEYLDKGFLAAIGLACMAFGFAVPHLPWDRWSDRALLGLALLAFATIALANWRGGVSPYSYAPFFIIVFMWVGLHFPARTSLVLALPAALAYAVPGLRQGVPAGAISSLTVAIPICVLVAETVAHGVARLRRAESRFEHGYDLLHRSQAQAKVGSWEWDRSTGASEWSPEMYRILGLDPATAKPDFAHVFDLVVALDREQATASFNDAARGRRVPGFEFRVVRPDGEERWIFCEGGVGEGGAVTGFVQDVTDRKNVQEELERLALRDHLTGLHNRRAFLTIGEQLIRIAQRTNERVLCVFIDLDNMKTVNDQFGHSAGDLALQAAAGLLGPPSATPTCWPGSVATNSVCSSTTVPPRPR